MYVYTYMHTLHHAYIRTYIQQPDTAEGVLCCLVGGCLDTENCAARIHIIVGVA